MVTAIHYDRPPIVEAVIDLKFESSFSEKEFERLRERFKKTFPSIEEKKQITVDIHPDGKVAHTAIPVGYKMTAQNAIDTVLINTDSFGTARLAPYERWENLQSAAEENFDIFTKVLGRRKIVRIGVRFINRIDVPNEKIEGRAIQDFIKVGISLPNNISKVVGGYSLSFAGIEESTGAMIRIRSGILSPALINHVSISLDIDVYFEKELPGRIDEIWGLVGILRCAKNTAFENCITNETRAFFR